MGAPRKLPGVRTTTDRRSVPFCSLLLTGVEIVVNYWNSDFQIIGRTRL